MMRAGWRSEDVAPRVGAWIETLRQAVAVRGIPSRPAWARGLKRHRRRRAAPLRKSRPAWARGLKPVLRDLSRKTLQLSRPAWARGLKLYPPALNVIGMESRPAWARGLKQTIIEPIDQQPSSRPAWARGLKRIWRTTADQETESRPAWARGLKQNPDILSLVKIRVAPRVGAWIETDCPGQERENRGVAPRVGAWIETNHPHAVNDHMVGRAPRGRVD